MFFCNSKSCCCCCVDGSGAFKRSYGKRSKLKSIRREGVDEDDADADADADEAADADDDDDDDERDEFSLFSEVDDDEDGCR